MEKLRLLTQAEFFFFFQNKKRAESISPEVYENACFAERPSTASILTGRETVYLLPGQKARIVTLQRVVLVAFWY